ncbi:hypothetical protein ACFOET_07575 [Parapedobacter deserti]|uniref:Uncharacterized protein n=1 Tax=Parapedobacter deserti TaxID=1912957 RepID=A0ABV7JHL4_9SPHI
MRKSYKLQDCSIEVGIKEGLIQITSDKCFRLAISRAPEQIASLLVGQVKADYYLHFGKALQVGDDSLIVEIWGHIYFEYFLQKYGRFLRIIFFGALYNRLCRSCEVIDCGEREKDPNRRIWDKLGPHRKRIARWLPKINS